MDLAEAIRAARDSALVILVCFGLGLNAACDWVDGWAEEAAAAAAATTSETEPSASFCLLFGPLSFRLPERDMARDAGCGADMMERV